MQKQLAQEYNNTSHAITNFPPAYLLLGELSSSSPHNQEIYPPINNILNLAKERTIKFHQKNKRNYDRHYAEPNFNLADQVIYEEFRIFKY